MKDRFDAWKNRLLIIKPETVIKWHRQGFGLYWKMEKSARTRWTEDSASTNQPEQANCTRESFLMPIANGLHHDYYRMIA
jgi:hypothetical protein